MSRPDRLVVVAGTDTEVGKTWVTCRVADHLRRAGRTIAVRKPVQSFLAGDGATDAELLGRASGEDPQRVCPTHRWYGVPMAPFMAADALGLPEFTLADLADEVSCSWCAPTDIALVESAGGTRSPMTHDGGDTVDLAAALEADRVVLVAHAGLGTINAVRLSLDALASFAVVVFLNRYDDTRDVDVRNCDWLRRNTPSPVVTDITALAHTL